MNPVPELEGGDYRSTFTVIRFNNEQYGCEVCVLKGDAEIDRFTLYGATCDRTVQASMVRAKALMAVHTVQDLMRSAP